jgi:hypothetical protein
VWALLKTVVSAVFKVTCGRVLCVHRDGSVHTVFDRASTSTVRSDTFEQPFNLHG